MLDAVPSLAVVSLAAQHCNSSGNKGKFAFRVMIATNFTKLLIYFFFVFGRKKCPCWHSVMAVCYGLFFKEQPHPCFLINTATLQFVTATVFSVNSKIAGTLGRIGMQSGLPGYLVEQNCFFFFLAKNTVLAIWQVAVVSWASGCCLDGSARFFQAPARVDASRFPLPS